MAYWSLTERSGWRGAQPVHTLPFRVLWPQVSEGWTVLGPRLTICRRLAPLIWFLVAPGRRRSTGSFRWSEMECCSRCGALISKLFSGDHGRHIKTNHRSAEFQNSKYKIEQGTGGFCFLRNENYPQVSWSLYRRDICPYNCIFQWWSLMSHGGPHPKRKNFFKGLHRGHPISFKRLKKRKKVISS